MIEKIDLWSKKKTTYPLQVIVITRPQKVDQPRRGILRVQFDLKKDHAYYPSDNTIHYMTYLGISKVRGQM